MLPAYFLVSIEESDSSLLLSSSPSSPSSPSALALIALIGKEPTETALEDLPCPLLVIVAYLHPDPRLVYEKNTELYRQKLRRG